MAHVDGLIMEQNREDLMAFVEVEKDLRRVTREASRVLREKNPRKGEKEVEWRGRSEQGARTVFREVVDELDGDRSSQQWAGAGCARP